MVNADSPEGAPPEVDAPEGVLVEPVPVNLGWAGGLHRARALTDAELLVWVQDDMVPEPGWLDALVDAADAHPEVGGFGAVRVDDEGGGSCAQRRSRGAVTTRSSCGTTPTRRPTTLPADVTTYDWVTSKGFLTRAAAFDEVGGPIRGSWPLNHVDKEYCTHLRCHGWDVALVAAAPGSGTAGSQSAPTAFRAFLAHWREPWFNQRWCGRR